MAGSLTTQYYFVLENMTKHPNVSSRARVFALLGNISWGAGPLLTPSDKFL